MSKTEREHPAYKYGTDKQFLKWITFQPSVIDGTYNQYDPDRNIPCHVRRLTGGAGLGIKPPFSAVPMTDEQHRIQSNHGERACLEAFNYIFLDDDNAQIWFEEKRDEMVEKWIEHRKQIMGEQ